MKNIIFFIFILFAIDATSQGKIHPLRLSQLNDVSIANAAVGDVLTKTAKGWKPSTPASVAITSTRIAVGTGTGIAGYANFTYDGTSILNVTSATNTRVQSQRSTNGAAYLETKNTVQTWQFYVSNTSGGLEPDVADGTFLFRNLANTSQFIWNTSTGQFSSVSGVSKFQVNGKGTTATGLAGYDSGNNLSDVSLGSNLQLTGGTLSINTTNLAGSFFAVGGNSLGATAATFGTNDVRPLHFETNNTRRFSIPSSGIANTPSSTKALVLSSTDSLGYTTLQSSDWTNTVTQSGSDTLLNAAAGYGHFQRIGNVVSFTLRVEIALTSAGDANTVYIDPPIASDFTTAASDVIGTATMDPQSLSGANTQRQRCVVFASDSDDKIGVSFDPVASLTYPENRMYISVSGSYVIQ